MEAEDVVRSHGGSVLRLAGLYNRVRGPHMYWLRLLLSNMTTNETFVTLPMNGKSEVNLLSYEDAANVTIKALLAGLILLLEVT